MILVDGLGKFRACCTVLTSCSESLLVPRDPSALNNIHTQPLLSSWLWNPFSSIATGFVGNLQGCKQKLL